MNKENTKVAKHLRDIGYLYEQDGDAFRARAYYFGAEAIEGLFDSLPLINGKFEGKIPGIGPGLKYSIEEFVETGSSTKFKELLQRGLPPPSVAELQKIPKVGIVTARMIWKTLGIASLEEFGARLKEIEKTEFAKHIEGYHKAIKNADRFPSSLIRAKLNESLVHPLVDLGYDIDYAGSMRRGRETIRDVDVIVCLNDNKQSQNLRDFLKKRGLTPDVRDGESKWGLTVPIENREITLDLNFCTPENRGAYYNYLTGSVDFNVAVRSAAKKKGILVNEHGFFNGKGKRLGGEKEIDLFNLLGIPYVPPECREEGAFGLDFSSLVEDSDLIADFHCHSTDSDGGASWELLVKAATRNGLRYLGISDHSNGSGNGPAGDKKQSLIQKFAAFKLKAERGGPQLFYGAEIDVRADGSLDYDRELIEKLDYFLIAAHHSDKNLTDRYIKAMQLYPKKPKIIAHPTNRLIGKRAEGDVAWDKLFKACKRLNTVLEINGQPDRQDLPPDIASAAQDNDVYVSINSDCHGINFASLLGVGVRCARRGWIDKQYVLNANPRLIENWLKGTLYVK